MRAVLVQVGAIVLRVLVAVLGVVVHSAAIALVVWTTADNFSASILILIETKLTVVPMMVAMISPAGLLPKWSSEVQKCKGL